MSLEEVVIPLSYLQRAFLIVSLEYDTKRHRFHLGKWQWLFAIPQACISISLLWTAVDETVRTTNLISVIRNANVWMEALLSIIYNVHNTYLEWKLGGRVLRDLLSFNDERRAMRISRSSICTANVATSNIKKVTRCALAICFVTNAIGMLQWLFIGETLVDTVKHLVMEVPSVIDNILVTKWCIYMSIVAEFNQCFLEDIERCSLNFDKNLWYQICRNYSRLHFIYRDIVDCFATFLVVFVVCQYMRLLWILYVLSEGFIIGRSAEFHAVYGALVQIFSLCSVVVPCLWIRQAANDVGRACSRIHTGSAGHAEVLNFQFQILVQDYNVRPHGAMELNGTLITSVSY